MFLTGTLLINKTFNKKRRTNMRVREFLLVFFAIFLFSSLGYSQVNIQLINCDNTTGWTDPAGAGAGMTTTATLTANADDFVEGEGSLIASVSHTGSTTWVENGNWTDFHYDFSSPMNLTGATDIRFWIKITQPTANKQAFQFTCDLFEGGETWRWAEDRDIFYLDGTGATEWHEVVIPISRLGIPHWVPPTGTEVLDLSNITAFAFGIHSRGLTDAIEVLFDDIRATGITLVSQVFSLDDVTGWIGYNNGVTENVVTIAQNLDDFIEGSGSLDVTFDMQSAPADWGSVAWIEYAFPSPVDLSGATEIRYWMKIIDGASQIVPPATIQNGEGSIQNIIAYWDIDDNPPGAAGTEIWRYIDEGAHSIINDEILHLKREPPDFTEPKWCEYVMPLDTLTFNHAGWSEPGQNRIFDLQYITTIDFGVGHVFGGAVGTAPADMIHLLLDDIHVTAGPTVGVNDQDNPQPFSFTLKDNFPNPFNPSTTIEFELPEHGVTSLKIYDLQGKEVRTIIDNTFKLKGSYRFNVDLSNLASGVYFYTLRQGDNIQTKKMTLLK